MGPAEIEVIAPMIFAIILTLTVGGVILLKPIANKLGHLLEAMAKERSQPQLGSEIGHIRDLLETTNARLALLEERQEFTEALLNDPNRRRPFLPGPASLSPSEPDPSQKPDPHQTK
jgi:hypothetical protein